MKPLIVILWAVLALPLMSFSATAQSAMSAAEFDAYTQGKTLFYGRGDAPYGAEIYLPGRRVRWSFLDGDCKDGEWYENAGLICFVYEDNPDPQCWSFRRTSAGLIAQFENEPGSTELYEADERGQEMLCLGPRIGV